MIPEGLRTLISGRPADELTARPVDGDTWLARLPGLIQEHLALWDLVPDGPARHGQNALVLPVRQDGRLAVVKFGWPHVEADDEHLALRLWEGRGMVRLLAANPGADTLLLERLDADRPLGSVSLLTSCEALGALFTTLDRPGAPQFTTVAAKASHWQEQLVRADGVPRRLLHQARATVADLIASAPPGRLVHDDLHDANVLAPLEAGRGGWVAIDPKAVIGEWAHAVAPAVWNRADEAARASSLRVHVRWRADVIADVAGLDLDRTYAWTFVRLVLNAVWAVRFAPASDAFRGRMVALAKAFADPPD